ncbi:pre-rRNA-processing protein las1-like [Hibiscus syriacus]|uniref:pre-rRNA-processing protein las1-like n=1 Tax=Hibiscus syriacus TaxID=106335 RepID=UPI001920E393|nr:pre-rRNA-processing protein las1-like [Hibiscus syriacus]
MEPLPGFEEEAIEAYNQESSSSTPSGDYKLVPWLNWAEWESVRKSLFSSSPRKISFALSRISTWRSRGCLPVVIDVTASIVEIQQSDPFFRGDKSNDGSHSEQMLAMLYCMAILRLVNCVIEKTRKRTGISIADAADAIGIPRRLIDVRHEGSHRDLPALTIARDSSVVALNWLKSYYWEPQKKLISFHRDGIVHTQREIKSKLRELALCIKVQQNPELRSLLVKGKGGRQVKHLCGRSKFFSLMAGKVHSCQSGGAKKRISKTLKSLVSLYSTSSSEVVSVLLEFLLKALDSSSSMNISKGTEDGLDKHAALDDWQPVIKKISKKEPELLLALLQRILDMIGTKDASKYETGHSASLESRQEAYEIEHLSSLFAWLVRHLELKAHAKGSVEIGMSNSILLELLRTCLLVSAFCNDHLLDSALHIAQLVGNSVLMEKLNKIRSLGLSSTEVMEENTSNEISRSFSQNEEYINQAAKKLELVKLHGRKNAVMKTADDDRNLNRWVVAKSWNPCPLGMLPRTLGSSGRIPVLDGDSDCQKDTESMEGKNKREHKGQSGKREASDDIQLMNISSPKKLKETVEKYHELGSEDVSSSSTCGHLMMDGVWKKVGETEVQAIASAVRIFGIGFCLHIWTCFSVCCDLFKNCG